MGYNIQQDAFNKWRRQGGGAILVAGGGGSVGQVSLACEIREEFISKQIENDTYDK